jgi:membrane protein YdbS with pleckstrin-like domain
MKKNIILIVVILVIIAGVLLYMHYTPIWNSISNVIFGSIGVVVGWFAHILYNK